MALTLRTNGIAGGLVSAAWWNDYYSLLTGSMSDQWVTISNGLTLMGDSATGLGDPSLALASGTALGIGSYVYAISFVMGDGECGHSGGATITTTSGNQKVNLTGIATGPAGTKARNIYRTKVGTSSPFYLLTTINDNTTTTYSDTTPDTSLVTQSPSASSFGGSLVIKTESGTKTLQLYKNGSIWADSGNFSSDGSGNVTVRSITTSAASTFNGNLSMGSGTHVSLDNGAITSDASGNLTAASFISPYSKLNPTGVVLNGSTSGTATLYQVQRGTYKEIVILINNFWNNGGSTQTISLPTPFTTSCRIETVAGYLMELRVGATAQNITIITALASGGGSTGTSTTIGGWSFGSCNAAVDTIAFRSGGSAAQTGCIILKGI